MNRKNIESLGARLELLGFEPGVAGRLAAFACFEPPGFDISHRLTEGAMVCDFTVQCIRGELGLYDAVFFIGVLRKEPPVPTGLESLDREMAAVDWEGLIAGRNGEGLNVALLIQAENAAKLLADVAAADSGGILRYKHWVGTALEALVPNLSQHKAQFEISQRFYLLAEERPISFREALRFLQSRWMEKQYAANKKLLLQKNESFQNGKGAGGGKLLTKRIKPSSKRRIQGSE